MSHQSQVVPSHHDGSGLVAHAQGAHYHCLNTSTVAFLLRCCEDPSTDEVHSIQHAGTMRLPELEEYVRRLRADHGRRHEAIMNVRNHLEGLHAAPAPDQPCGC